MELLFDSVKRKLNREKKNNNNKTINLDNIIIQIDINKINMNNIMNNIIHNIITKICSSNVVSGYNDYRDFYWLKIYNNHSLLLHVEIIVNELLEEKCKIIFKTKFGDFNTINNFVDNFKNNIDIYKNSKIVTSLKI